MLRVYVLSLFVAVASAQFQFFDQFFGGQQQQQQQQGNVASDSSWFASTWQGAACSNYLCPDTLACVHFPHHCPCAFSDVEDKLEMGEGARICASRGGWKEDETIRKIELARQGLI